MSSHRETIHGKHGAAFDVYVATPDGPGPSAGVVVLQEIFGVNAVIREICDALANEGYLAVAPDLFWRIERNIDITDQTEAEMARAFELFGVFDVEKGLPDIQTTIDWLRKKPECTGRVAAIGYCLGGLLAYLSATRTDADASVAYYAVGLQTRLDEVKHIRKPFLLHMAESDEYVPPAAQGEIKAAFAHNPNITLFGYPGRNHAFARTGGKNFNREDAGHANDRTVAFLKKAQL
jgi:carboxymethylenebutenolidase